MISAILLGGVAGAGAVNAVQSSSSTGNARGNAFLAMAMQPEQAARSLMTVEDGWQSEVALCASQQETGKRKDLVNCFKAPEAFAKSCGSAMHALVEGSGEKRDADKYLADVCRQRALEGWHRSRCVSIVASIHELKANIQYRNRVDLLADRLCSDTWAAMVHDQKKTTLDHRSQASTEAAAEARRKAAESSRAANADKASRKAWRNVKASSEAKANAKAIEAKVAHFGEAGYVDRQLDWAGDKLAKAKADAKAAVKAKAEAEAYANAKVRAEAEAKAVAMCTQAKSNLTTTVNSTSNSTTNATANATADAVEHSKCIATATAMFEAATKASAAAAADVAAIFEAATKADAAGDATADVAANATVNVTAKANAHTMGNVTANRTANTTTVSVVAKNATKEVARQPVVAEAKSAATANATK
jgi:hypothetical protein